MIIPKRFKLDKAAAPKPMPETGLQFNCIHLAPKYLLASEGSCAAIVPLLGPTERPGADMPRLEAGEEPHIGPLPLAAVKEATKGKTGSGTLRTGASSTEAQSASGKQWIRVENPTAEGQVPNFTEALNRTEDQAPPTHRYVEVCVNAQLLAGLAQAIGAEEAVKLRFLVDNESGRADAGGEAHGVVDVRPVREAEGGRGVLMVHVVRD